jgi:nucleotide-binding universal stress UspA family protein
MPTAQEVARVSLKNILFPTDFSPASSAALPFALALARVYGATVLLTHVIPPEPHRQVMLDRLPVQDGRVCQDAVHRLTEFSADRQIGDIPCKSLIDQGDLTNVIPQIIREQDVDLVVLGTRGRRGMSRLVLGSSAEKIYRSAPCPVLTVGPNVHAAEWKLTRILCPVDAVQDPKPLLHYAVSLAEENRAEFIVLQAVPLVPWQHRASVEVQMRERLELMIPEHSKDWCTPQFLVRWEHPAEAILLAAAEREPDLIVMGVRRARAAGLSSHLPWPVASEVVSRAPCPVLTVRV